MRNWLGLVAVAAGVGLLIGVCRGGFLRGEPAPVAPGAPQVADATGEPDSQRTEIAALREALASERQARAALEAEVERLNRKVESLEAAALDAARTDLEPTPSGDEPGDAEDEQSRTRRSLASADLPPWFDDAALEAQGVPPWKVARLRELFEQAQMQELFLRDRATREGWFRKARYSQELGRLRNELREELGDEDYDLMLYATGRHNRVVLAEVLERSPAAEAGLRAGDVVVSYGERRVFDGQSLKGATFWGEPGDPTPIEVLRDGERMRFFVPRGPLGVRLRPTVRPPETRW